MNIHLKKIRQSGMVLPTTLVIALLVGIVVAGLLLVSQQQNYLTARSRTWSSEIPIAEAGIEEAMAHLNTRPVNWATHGWSNSGGNIVKTRTLGDDSGYYYTVISTARPPTIVSIGFGRIPLQTNYTSRRVMALTKLSPPAWGIVAKQSISMNGSVLVDSYDSSDSQYSGAGGTYDPARARDRAGVATLSSATPAIDTGGAEIYGSVATGPGGSASGTVGDGTWVNTQSGIQPGHFTDDFNMAIDDVILPPELRVALPPLPGIVGGTLYTYVLGNGDYMLPLGLTLGGGLVVTGKARLYVNGSTKVSGSGSEIKILNGGTLEMYLNGDADIGGGGIVNGTQLPAMCSIYGMTTCTSLKYSGNALLNAKIYAPQAHLNMTGTTDFSGSIVANSIRFVGTPAIHYDEALSGSGPDYRIVSWEEL